MNYLHCPGRGTRGRLRPMARIPRKFQAGRCYHVMNRGNRRATVFHKDRDYRALLRILAESQERVAMRVLAVCLMPNHFHFVLQPNENKDMSKWMHWVMTTQVARYRIANNTIGRIWAGRFKSFPIQHDAHLLAVLRYVERNALRAGLVSRAEDWRWGSLSWRGARRPMVAVTEPPVPLPNDWSCWVNMPQTSAELEAMRRCANSQTPFGDPEWVDRVQRGHD